MFQHRSSDAVIVICQDNDAQQVRIHDFNHEAEEALGYSKDTIAGRALVDFLPKRIQTLLTEYVEFEDLGNDVGNVLAKVQSFCILDKNGKEFSYRLKVLRSESLDKHDYFQLILQDKTGIRKDEAFREMLRENFKGHEVLDAETGLADRSSVVKDIELVSFYVKKDALEGSFAMLEIDNYDEIAKQHGKETGIELIKHIAHIAKQNLRTDDTVGRCAERHLGLLLMDTNIESSRMVLNRLRWLIAASPYDTPELRKPVSATVSIAFCPIKDDAKDKDLVPLAEACLKVNGLAEGNALLEIPE